MNSPDDCLNLRKGIYYIENLLLSDCKDKGINVSYNSKANIENLLLKIRPQLYMQRFFRYIH